MMTTRQLKLLQKLAAREKKVVEDLDHIAKDIERAERTIVSLTAELNEINQRFQGPRTTAQDVAYLSGLLECAKKKLVWEKQISSLRNRSDALLQEVSELVNNPETAPAEETRREMLAVLQKVQAAMERLQAVNLS